MRILVTGAAGQLGTVMTERCRRADHDVVAADRRTLDLTRHAEVLQFAHAARPHVIINCAAFNDVDGAESRHAEAFDVNAFAVRSLARAAAETGAVLVHYSTDFVFDGETDRPYSEDDRPRPQSVYASSKFLGECFARDAGRYYVLRVESLFGGPAPRSSIDRILASLTAGQPARLFVDRVVSPSYVEDVTTATWRLVETAAAPGLYHCVNSGHTTWFEVGREIARLTGAPEDLLVPVRVDEVTLLARRPKFAALNNDRLRTAGAPMPPWTDPLARYLRVVASRHSGGT